jgi:hypothetical protein
MTVIWRRRRAGVDPGRGTQLSVISTELPNASVGLAHIAQLPAARSSSAVSSVRPTLSHHGLHAAAPRFAHAGNSSNASELALKLGMKENAMEAARETGKLISTDKVAGTNVYNTLGDTLSAIHDLMIDKATGKVAYALMSVGGFLGIGNQYYPLAWSLLKYDPIWVVTSSISTNGGWKARRLTTSVQNQRGRPILRRRDSRLLRSGALLGQRPQITKSPTDGSTRHEFPVSALLLRQVGCPERNEWQKHQKQDSRIT